MAPIPLAKVIGSNCRRIRTSHGLTQDEVARYAREFGLRWNAAKVGDFESGRSAPTFATVLVVSLSLHSAVRNSASRDGDLGASIHLPELFAGDAEVQMNDDLILPEALLSLVCEGQSWSSPPWNLWKPTPGLQSESSLAFEKDLWGEESLSPPERLLVRFGLTEDRIARQMGIDRRTLSDLSYLLWRKTFSEERDVRAGAESNQQTKGRVSRELKAELKQELERGND